MATVITNLLSAIPFIGQDIVPLSIILPLYCIYLFTMNFNLIYYIYIITYNRNNFILNEYYNNNLIILESNLNPINKDLLALIIGFIDGDGYIRISNKSKDNKEYIYISLVINLKENESELLNTFCNHLSLGKVYNITPKKGNKLVRWEINKTDLINKFIPLLEKHNIAFLTEKRQYQYLLLKYIIINNIIYFKDINNNIDNINKYINDNKIKYNFNKLYYFNNWLVGFTMAEGSFLKKNNNDICFQLKQKYNLELFKDISNYFNTKRSLDINKNKYIQFSVSSKKDIQNIINFFSFSNNCNLLGTKLVSYNKWLLDIKNSSRYNKLNLPKIINL